jgi:Zn-finger nucleic acid-binding protein
MDDHPRYRGLWLDGHLAELHRAVDRLRWDAVPAPLGHQPPSPPRPHRRRRDPGDGQVALVEEAS